jgi:hypothetical protein
MAKKQKPKTEIRVTLPTYETMTVKVRSITPLIMNHLHEYSGDGIEWDEKGKAHSKTATKKKEKRNPDKEYRKSMYLLSPTKRGKPNLGLPMWHFKRAMVEACTPIDGLHKSHMKRAFRIVNADFETGLIKPSKISAPSMKHDIVRDSGVRGAPRNRFRASIQKWEATLEIQFNTDYLCREEVFNLLVRAGLDHGIGDKNVKQGHDFGMFEVVTRKAS